MATAGPSPTKAAVKPVAKPATSTAKAAPAKPAVGVKPGAAKTGTAAKTAAAKASAKAAPAPAPAPVSVAAKEVDPQMAAAAVGGLIVLLLGGYFAFGRPKTPYRVPPRRPPAGIQPSGGSQPQVFGSGQPQATKPGTQPVNTGPTPPPAVATKPGTVPGAVPVTGVPGQKVGGPGAVSPSGQFTQAQQQPATPFGPGQGTQTVQQPPPAVVGSGGGQPMQSRQPLAPMAAQPPVGQPGGQQPVAGQPLEGGTSASLIGETKGKAAPRGDGQEIIQVGAGSKVVPLEAPAPPPKN